MNQQAIEQLGRALDVVFGKPGSAQIALQNIELIKALADAVAAFNEAQRQEQADGPVHTDD